MELHLFSSPGESGIEHVLEACRPFLAGQPRPVVAYCPAASLSDQWIDYTERAFAGLGKVVTLDTDVMPPAEAAAVLNHAAVLYIPGGNTYLLAHRLHRSGFFSLIRSRIENGLPLVAFSAGTVLCGPNVLTANDINACACTTFAGLELLPYNINVHYPPADTPRRTERDEWLGAYHFFHDQPILCLEDGVHLRLAAGRLDVLRGAAWLLAKNSPRALFSRSTL